MVVRVAILDDDPGQRASLSAVLNAEPGFQVVGQFGSLAELEAALPGLQAEVVLVDVQLPDGNGVSAVALLHERKPEAKAIVLTVINDSGTLLAALQAGAGGYLLKRADSKDLVVRLRELLAGEVPMSPGIALRLLEHFRRMPGDPAAVATLTPAEREVLGLLASGYTNKEIAAARGVSVPTVRTQLGNIYRHLRVKGRTGAVALVGWRG